LTPLLVKVLVLARRITPLPEAFADEFQLGDDVTGRLLTREWS